MNAHASFDPVERALALLRDAAGAELPDPVLEARLREQFARRSRRRRPRLFHFALGLGLCSGAALAAGGLERLARWWFEVEIDGQAQSGAIEGDGERTITFDDEEGTSGTVRVRRDELEDGALRTRIDVDRVGPDRVEQERAEDVVGRSARSVSLASLPDAREVAAGTDDLGRAFALYALADDAGGSQLFLSRVDASELVTEVAHLPFDVLAAGARVEAIPRTDGELAIRVDDGRGSSAEFLLRRPAAASLPAPREPLELETPDGRVRVRVGSDER